MKKPLFLVLLVVGLASCQFLPQFGNPDPAYVAPEVSRGAIPVPPWDGSLLICGATVSFDSAASGHLPDFKSLPAEVLDRTAIAYACSPANPQGAVADEGYWRDLIALAEKHDFMIFADECYSEIYRNSPPPGALEVATKMGADPERVLIFHSLSKRSNLPGLRAGFCAGGPESIKRMRLLRAFAGAPLSEPLQAVATACWNDEDHVVENRAR